jgi:hypothetical protein
MSKLASSQASSCSASQFPAGAWEVNHIDSITIPARTLGFGVGEALVCADGLGTGEYDGLAVGLIDGVGVISGLPSTARLLITKATPPPMAHMTQKAMKSRFVGTLLTV